MGSVEPYMNTINEATRILETMEETGSTKRMARVVAKFQKDMYDALVEEGFSRADALEVLCSMEPPLKVGR